jgi:hypothetical protein
VADEEPLSKAPELASHVGGAPAVGLAVDECGQTGVGGRVSEEELDDELQDRTDSRVVGSWGLDGKVGLGEGVGDMSWEGLGVLDENIAEGVDG